MTTDETFIDRLAKREARPGPRVGDFIRLPRVHRHHPEFTRITHDWGDTMQTGGNETSSCYLCEGGGISYSGGLDRGVRRDDLVETGETKTGMVWVFKDGISGAGRGVSRPAPMRVFSLRRGADLSGLGELDSSYYLTCLDQSAHEKTCGYWYLIDQRCTSHTAFRSRPEVLAWMEGRGLVPGGTIPVKTGTHAWMRLHYADDVRLVRVGDAWAIK
jgi:hypothetical protein